MLFEDVGKDLQKYVNIWICELRSIPQSTKKLDDAIKADSVANSTSYSEDKTPFRFVIAFHDWSQIANPCMCACKALHI